MMDEQFSLANLRDIVEPVPPPVWPPAPEVWILLAILIAGAAILVYQWRRRRHENAYRRAGLALLDRAETVQEISVILKRVALAAFTREQVASLVGDEWAAFLRQTCPGRDFSPLVQESPNAEGSDELKRLARTWISRHRVNGEFAFDGKVAMPRSSR